MNPRIRSVKGVYKTYVDAIHFRLAGVEEVTLDPRGYVILINENGDITITLR